MMSDFRAVMLENMFNEGLSQYRCRCDRIIFIMWRYCVNSCIGPKIGANRIILRWIVDGFGINHRMVFNTMTIELKFFVALIIHIVLISFIGSLKHRKVTKLGECRGGWCRKTFRAGAIIALRFIWITRNRAHSTRRLCPKWNSNDTIGKDYILRND